MWVGTLCNINVRRLGFKKAVDELNMKLEDVEGKCSQIVRTAVDPIITTDDVC